MHLVDLAEQGIVHHTTRKLLLEVPDSVLEREARLLLQSLCVDNPIGLMRFQKPETKSFSTFEFLEWDLSFLEWTKFLHEW